MCDRTNDHGLMVQYNACKSHVPRMHTVSDAALLHNATDCLKASCISVIHGDVHFSLSILGFCRQSGCAEPVVAGSVLYEHEQVHRS